MSHEIVATWENHGRTISLLWQSKHTRPARRRVRSQGLDPNPGVRVIGTVGYGFNHSEQRNGNHEK